jgi:hypothetical protein
MSALVNFDFDLSVIAKGRRASDSRERSSSQEIFKKPSVASRKPKEAGFVPPVTPLAETPEEPEFGLVDAIEGYKEFISRAEDILSVIKERSKNLTYHFSPEEKFTLSNAVSAIFKGVNDHITYNMYLAALRLEKDISIQIGDSEVGHLKNR